MWNKTIIVLFGIVCSGCVGWSKANTAMEVAFVAEQSVDYRQTSEAVQYGGEANPIIGAWGQNVSPQAYFLTTTLAHAFVSSVLPRRWREAFQGATLAEQGYNIYGNVKSVDQNRHNSCAARVGHANPCF